MAKKVLQIQQLNSKMQALAPLQKLPVPPVGWLKAIRLALGMSARQLGNKLSVTRQAVVDMERRETEGSITIKALREAAEALDMQLVYGFVSKDGSLDTLIERKALELASRIVLTTSNTMRLEDQENSAERIRKAIEEKSNQFKNELPKILWD
jgi:predicted DNA-binding mobile mystery protein A